MKLVSCIACLLFITAFAAAQTASWRDFSSSEGRFSVAMPGEPTASVVSVTYKGERSSNTFTYTDDDLNQFMVAYSDRLGNEPRTRTNAQLYDKARDGILIATEGKLVRESPVMLNGFLEGRELVIERTDGTVQTERLFMVGSRIYQISAEVKKAGDRSADVERFLNSFRLIS